MGPGPLGPRGGPLGPGPLRSRRQLCVPIGQGVPTTRHGAALMEACARAPGAGGVGACALPSWFPPHLQYAKRTELTHRRAWPSESPQALERHCTWEEGRYTRNSVLKGDGFEAMVSSQSAKRVC